MIGSQTVELFMAQISVSSNAACSAQERLFQGRTPWGLRPPPVRQK